MGKRGFKFVQMKMNIFFQGEIMANEYKFPEKLGGKSSPKPVGKRCLYRKI
jgi:hypothetical protein